MIGMAAPFNVAVKIHKRDGDTCWEKLAPGCFLPSVSSGLSAKGRPVFLCIGHKRDGRRRWKLANTSNGSLRIWQDERALWFEAPRVSLPDGFAGCSVKLQPVRWRRIGPAAILLTETFFAHVAIIIHPDYPCYPETYPETLKLN